MPSTPAGSPTGRRTGRPRQHGPQATGDPIEEILAAAGRLLSDLGVNGMTMSRLAAAVGLGQSSLYYYFGSREDVVAALVARANVIPLALIEQIAASPGSSAAKLHLFVRRDVEALCALAFDINEIHRLAVRDRDRFAGYWAERAVLERRLAALVRTGISNGEFREVDPRAVTSTILSNDEGTQNWHRAGRRRSASAMASVLADLTVAGLLTGPRDLDDIRCEAHAMGFD